MTPPFMDMDLRFNEHPLIWSGGCLPIEPARNEAKSEQNIFVLFEVFHFFGTKG
jgi:hypothetical protein